MNIRSLSHIITPISSSAIKEAQQSLRSHDTAERDADGREHQSSAQRPVSEEELEKILKSLRENAGIIANNLSVELEVQNEVRVLLIKSPDGHIVRRVSEKDFYQLLETMGQSNGLLISKAA